MAAAAAEFGSVAGAKEDGAVQVTRNSILGPYFEYVAFSTPVGKMSRPFRTTNGYALIKVDSVEKGAQTGLDKVLCHVVQFAYSPDQKVMQQAQFKVNSGQVDIRVRDQAVLDLLPALFKPPVARATPLQQAQQQIKQIETLLKELGDTDPEKAKILNEQLGKMRLRTKTPRTRISWFQPSRASSTPSSARRRSSARSSAPKWRPTPADRWALQRPARRAPGRTSRRALIKVRP